MRISLLAVVSATLLLSDASSQAEVIYRATPAIVLATPPDVDPDPVAAFDHRTGVTGSADVISQARQLTGHVGIPVSISGTTAQYRLCQNADCATGTVGSWTLGQSTASSDQWVQLKMTPNTTSTTPRIATLTYGGRTATWSVTAADSCAVGAVCSDGTILASSGGTGGATLYGGVEQPFVQAKIYVTAADAPSTMVFSQALSYCDNLVNSGFSDWLLPHTTIVYDITRPANLSKYGTVAGAGYWINSPTNTHPSYKGMQHSVTSVSTGQITNSDPNTNYRVRCMRVVNR